MFDLRRVPILAALVLLTTVPAASGAEHRLADVPALEKAWSKTLNAEIARLKQRFKGRISVYVSDPTIGIRYGYDVERSSYLASAVKVSFMVEAFRQVERGLLSWDEALVFDSAAQRDGAPRMRKLPLGSKIKVGELVRMMIQHSDNAASDLLVGRLGIENVNAGIRLWVPSGFNRLTRMIDVRRGIFREVDPRGDDLTNLEIRAVRWTWGWRSHVAKLTEILGRPPGAYSVADLHAAYGRFYALGVNNARVDALGELLEKLLRGEVVSPSASRQMLAIMYGAKTSTRRMMGLLPPGTRVAHKTGSQWERICDHGVIDLPDRHPLVFAGCLAGGRNRTLAEETLARAARKAYDLAVSAHR